MPLNIHKDCRARLHELLTKALPTLKAENGMFIDRMSALGVAVADMSLPRTGILRDQLVEYIDEFPLVEFVLATLGKELWELDKFVSDGDLSLSEIEGYSDPQAISTKLLDEFETLPWSYQFTIQLPETLNSILHPTLNEFRLSPTIRITRYTDNFAQTYPLDTGNPRRNQALEDGPLLSFLLTPQKPCWDQARLYLQIAAQGFVDPYGGTSTSQSVERNLRSLFGLAVATRLLEHKYKYSPTPHTYVYVHRLVDDKWLVDGRYRLPETVHKAISNLEVIEHSSVKDEDEQNVFRAYLLQNIGVVFAAGERADQISLGAQWLFDSYVSQDELLSFVQSMVVLEILLGDKAISDEIGIGELIRNRFAYLIGTSQKERTELMTEFKKIYDVRSQIVHSGKHRLNYQERSLLHRLRWMCRRTIDKEVDFLRADISKEFEEKNRR